jgi:hypothetical protein
MKDNNSNNNEPIVLGELKKDKSSKPIFVFIIFALLIGTCFGLPYIKNYVNNNDNSFTRFYRTYLGSLSGDEESYSNNDNNSTGSNITLSKASSINYGNFVVNNFTIGESEISYSITSTTTVTLDEQNLYLEIYSSNNSLIGRVKLIGTYKKGIKTEVTSKLIDFKLNTLMTYYIKINNVKIVSYPDVTLSNDTLTCKADNKTYVYTFKNAALISMDETYNYKKTTDLTTYMTELNSSNMKANLIKTFTNCTSSTTETETGFTFLMTIDLTNIKRSDFKDYIDYNVYDLNAEAKQVSYEMKTKGFSCS